MSLRLRLEGAMVLAPDGLTDAPLCVSAGHLTSDLDAPPIDLSGFTVLPGIVDPHGDGFERHVAPRRGAVKDMVGGIGAVASELAANGITTAVLAQFFSWEGGLRGPDFAAQFLSALDRARPDAMVDLRVQLRLETHLLDLYEDFADLVARHGVDYVVFNDHLPHDRLAAGRKPPRLTGTALKSGRSPEALFDLMLAMEARRAEVPAALAALAARLAARGVRLGSHDDATADDRSAARTMGATIAEFPETMQAAEAAHADGDPVILGAPNVMRGGSHKGNASAIDLISMGLCTALASDYHYPAPMRAAFLLVNAGVLDLQGAWGLVSSGPARVLGLDDRGALAPGQRADFIVLDDRQRLCASFSAGRVACLSGDIAQRFFANVP